jgi:type IV pilus assembly protein PilA
MYCPNCGAQMAEGAGRCPQCGVDPRGFVAQHTAAPAPPPMPSGQVPPSPLAGTAPRRGMPVIGIVALVGGILFFLFVVLGILAAIAIPDFLRFQAKAKQSEARQNLAMIYTEQAGYRAEHDRYASDFDEIQWKPAGTTRYAYFLPGQALQPRIGGPFELPADVKPYAGKNGFMAVAVGNVDNDATLDVWVITEQKELKNLVNDTMQ